MLKVRIEVGETGNGRGTRAQKICDPADSLRDLPPHPIIKSAAAGSRKSNRPPLGAVIGMRKISCDVSEEKPT